MLQIAANLGILAGLVLVGLQIREANRLADTQFEFDAWGGAMRAHEIVMGDDFADSWTRAQCNDSALTAKDVVLVNAFLSREWLHNTRVAKVRRAGYDQTEQDLTGGKWLATFLGNETALKWWQERYGDGTGSFLSSNPELRDEINEMVKAAGKDHAEFHRKALERLHEGVCG